MIAAATAPGTELDRSGTLPGAKRTVGVLPWLLLAVLVGGAALTGAVVLRSRANAVASGASSSAASALPRVEASAPLAAPVSVAPVVAAPVATASEAASAVPAGLVSAAPAAHGKPAVAIATVASKGRPQPAPPKVAAPGAPPPLAPAPKYTRD